jgi:hypothetical protein
MKRMDIREFEMIVKRIGIRKKSVYDPFLLNRPKMKLVIYTDLL